MSIRRFEFQEGGSSKFWEVEPRGNELTIRWGKIGTAGQSQVKSFSDEAAATKELNKLAAEKTKKGYVEVGGGASAPTPEAKPPAKEAKPAASKVVAPPTGKTVEKVAASGGVRFQAKQVHTARQITPPVIDGDTLFFGAHDQAGSLHAVGLDGKPRWNQSAGESGMCLHATATHVVVSSPFSSTGVVEWRARETGALIARLEGEAIACTAMVGDTVFAVLKEERWDNAQNKHVRRAEDAEILVFSGPNERQPSIRAPAKTYPIVSSGGLLIAVAANLGKVVAYRTSGEEAWRCDGWLAGHDGSSLVVLEEDALVFRRASDGGEVWRRAGVAAPGTAPSAGLGQGVVAISENRTPRLDCFDAATGELRWTAPLTLPKRGFLPPARPLVTSLAVLRPDASDRLVAYDLRSGAVLGVMKERTERGLDGGACVAPGAPDSFAVCHRGDSASSMYLVTLGAGASAAAAKPKAKASKVKAGSFDLATRLEAYFDLLAKRTDLTVVERKTEPPDAALAIEARVPEDLRAFAKKVGRLAFTWILEGESPAGSSAGYNGGRFSFRSQYLGEFQEADWAVDRESPFTHFIGIDDLVEEGNGWLVLPSGGGAAVMGFENSNDDAFTPLGSFEAYVTQGAKRAFCWYWPTSGGEGDDFVEKLLDNSVDDETPPDEMAGLLEARGAEPGIARALVDWLGPDVRILLQRE